MEETTFIPALRDSLCSIDFESDEISEENLQMLLFNIEEDHEIILEGDLAQYFVEEFTLDEIPSIQDVEKVEELKLFCPKCFKGYKRKTFYHKHVLICSGKTVKIPKRRTKKKVGGELYIYCCVVSYKISS